MTGKEERQAAAAAAKAKRTTETHQFLEAEARQRGDRLFKVVRVYPSGHKATVGTTHSPKDAVIGAQFGGGVYELHELDRATEFETGKIVKATLHPSAYPPKKEFQKDPHELDLEAGNLERAGAGPSAANGGLAGLTRDELFMKAKAEAMAEFRREEAQRQLDRKLAELDLKLERINNGEIGGVRKSPLEEIAAMFDMFKKFMPPPTPNLGGAGQLSPAAQLQESMELIKSMRGALKELQGETADGRITPMGEKMLSSLTDLAQRGFSAWERTQRTQGPGAGAGQVIDQPAGWAQTRPAPAAPPAPLAPPAPAPAAAGGWAETKKPAANGAPVRSANWPQVTAYNATRADFGTDEDWARFQEDSMTFELIEFTKKEMAGIIAGEPGFSIFRTAEEIRRRWIEPGASAAWLKLRDGIRTYETDVLVNHFVGLQPELCPTPKHRDCLAALIDVIKEREGVKA